MLEPTPLYGGNAEFLDALYEQYLRDPASVEERWRTYFTQLAPAEAAGAPPAHPPHPPPTARRAARPAGRPRARRFPRCARTGQRDRERRLTPSGTPPPRL